MPCPQLIGANPRISARRGQVVDLNVDFLHNGILTNPYAIWAVEIYKSQVLPHNLVATISIADPTDPLYPAPLCQEFEAPPPTYCGTETPAIIPVAGRYHLPYLVPVDSPVPDIYFDLWYYYAVNPALAGDSPTGGFYEGFQDGYRDYRDRDPRDRDLRREWEFPEQEFPELNFHDPRDFTDPANPEYTNPNPTAAALRHHPELLLKCCHRFWIYPENWFCDDRLQTVRFGFEPLDQKFYSPEQRTLEIGLMPLPLYDYNFNLVTPLIPFLTPTITIETQHHELLVDKEECRMGLRQGSYKTNPFVIQYDVDTTRFLKGTYQYHIALRMPDGSSRVSRKFILTIA